MASSAAVQVRRRLPEESLAPEPEALHKEAVPTLRELEANIAEQTVLAQARERQKANFLVRLLRELGLVKEPGLCHGFTRQAVACRRPALRDGFCRLHAKPQPGKRSLWQRLAGAK